MRNLVLASLLLALAGVAHADIAPLDPKDRRPAPERAPPESQKPSPQGKACGVGAGMALLGIGIFGAWRLSKTQRKAQLA